jgi:hypothetical protein
MYQILIQKWIITPNRQSTYLLRLPRLADPSPLFPEACSPRERAAYQLGTLATSGTVP